MEQQIAATGSDEMMTTGNEVSMEQIKCGWFQSSEDTG